MRPRMMVPLVVFVVLGAVLLHVVGTRADQPSAAQGAAGGSHADSILQFSTVYTHHLTLSPVTFRPSEAAPDYKVYNSGATGGTGSVALEAPIELPDNATITSVRFVAYDNASPVDVRMRIDRFPVAGSTVYYVAMTRTSGASPAYQTLTSTVHEVVDNENYYYFAIAFPTDGTWDGSNTTAKCVIITYTVEGISGIYLPLVRR
jgi:hypothetical protein